MRRASCALALLLLVLPSRADWPEARDAFAKRYSSAEAADRLKAVKGLTDFDRPEAVGVLLECWRGEADSEVRNALADVFSRMADKKARAELRDTILKNPEPETRARYCGLFAGGRQSDRFDVLDALLVDSSPDVRIRALRYIGATDRLLLPDVGGLLEDPLPEIRFGAAGALAAIGSIDAVPWLADRLAIEKGEGLWAVQDALERITGQKLGTEKVAWVNWWKDKTSTEPPEVKEAVAKAAKWLRNDTLEKLRTGLWNGFTTKKRDPLPKEVPGLALQIHALIHAGLPADDEVIQDGVYWLETFPLSRTYDVACAAMALADDGAQSHRDRLTEMAQWLVDAQCANGQWSYTGTTTIEAKKKSLTRTRSKAGSEEIQPEPPKVVIRNNPRKSGGDNSNTQYGVLGLRAALEVCDVPDRVFEKTLEFFQDTQKQGWGYEPRDDPSGTMTGGGISTVTVCLNALSRTDGLEPDKVGQHKLLGPAISWFGRHWTISIGTERPFWQYYYLYGIERAAVLSGQDKFGKHDWYREGTAWLLSHQAPTGEWHDYAPDQDTSFAILFLKRATQGLVGKPKRKVPAPAPVKPPPDVESGK